MKIIHLNILLIFRWKSYVHFDDLSMKAIYLSFHEFFEPRAHVPRLRLLREHGRTRRRQPREEILLRLLLDENHRLCTTFR